MAGRPRSGSRLSQLLRQSQASRGGEFDNMDEPHSTAQSSHSALLSRAEFSPSKPATFSSLDREMTPARSYFHRSIRGSHGAVDISQDDSEDVREDTAELASWALSDRVPLSNRHSTSEHLLPATNQLNRPSIHTRGKKEEPLENSHSVSFPRSDVIPEVSEPASSSSMLSSRKTARMSALSRLFNQAPSSDEEDQSANEEYQSRKSSGVKAATVREGIISQPTERSALLLKQQVYGPGAAGTDFGGDDLENQKAKHAIAVKGSGGTLYNMALRRGQSIASRFFHPKTWNCKVVWEQALVRPAGYVPSVILGLLLNILDALSYGQLAMDLRCRRFADRLLGMILFPLGQPIFANLGVDGISMFYVSCIVSQLVYSLGGSMFKGGIGSEMIEVVPFFHKMAFQILTKVGDNNPKAVLATTILSYSISSVVTGVVFFLMGKCRLGTLIGFFPRHILISCIGGVGFFLVVTGVEVSARLDGNLNYDLGTLKELFEADTVALWIVPLALAILLFLVKHWVKHPLVDATYFISIIAIFYFFVAAIDKLELPDLRSKGWVFRAPDANIPFYHFYTLYDFEAVDWAALVDTLPTMLALTFFGIIHVPINVPALGFTMGEDDVDIDRELKAHGLSNALSGFCGSIQASPYTIYPCRYALIYQQNYLVYTNSVLFARSGGNSRVAGIMLAFATFGVLISGPVIVGYIPIMVVGALIFFLGIDLMREALVDTWGKVHRLEYLTILVIVITMGAWDFVIGILIGILLACVSFVLQTSRISAVRSKLPGSIAASTVRRHPLQKRFLQDAGKQIYVIRLAGYLFFGTIVGVEKQIRTLLLDQFEREPIRFLILDLQNVDGVDFSAAEAFTRVNRILNVKGVRLIICGISGDGEIGTALYNVGLFEHEDMVKFFETLNSALEHCENDLLLSLYQQRANPAAPDSSPTFLSKALPRSFSRIRR
ncbi:MAG: hypothetical protein Q9219_000501 [cf. Caloplaca sp. 3 TL-2023]